MQRTPSTPPEIDGYLIDRLIGSGGFADVFLYEQQLPRRKVAVKALLTHELTASARAAFTSEADLMARLSTHPYIVTIYQAGVARDGRPYLVMEYCSRPSLAERYKRQPLSVVDALRTGIRLAGAVATAHSAGILHRDIKPGNVLTNDYGWPALTDFGIASEVAGPGGLPTIDGAGGTDVDASVGASVGMSVPWSPPEMFEDVPTPDVRSDVFSLAA
jgi:serine/threonine protein kinase